jgi:hypothetical protein
MQAHLKDSALLKITADELAKDLMKFLTKNAKT